MPAPSTQAALGEHLKRVMAEFMKANEGTWVKNKPPYLKTALAAVVWPMLREAWALGNSEGADGIVGAKHNPYKES